MILIGFSKYWYQTWNSVSSVRILTYLAWRSVYSVLYKAHFILILHVLNASRHPVRNIAVALLSCWWLLKLHSALLWKKRFHRPHELPLSKHSPAHSNQFLIWDTNTLTQSLGNVFLILCNQDPDFASPQRCRVAVKDSVWQPSSYLLVRRSPEGASTALGKQLQRSTEPQNTGSLYGPKEMRKYTVHFRPFFFFSVLFPSLIIIENLHFLPANTIFNTMEIQTEIF